MIWWIAGYLSISILGTCLICRCLKAISEAEPHAHKKRA